MLYALKQLPDKGPVSYYLTGPKDYVIGRKKTDIIINDDDSISRKHAIIKIGSNSATLTDAGSKYGTSRNNSKLAPNTEILLQNNDVIKFGVYHSIFRFEKINLITAGSGLTNEQKIVLKQKVSAVGGSITNNWDSTCSYLTAEEIMLTVKVLHAIIDEKPIVTLKFWDQFLKNVKELRPPPNPDDFKPPIAETLINKVNLEAKPERRNLFKDKIFVFPTEKIKSRMISLIEKTGGTGISWEKQPVTLQQITSKSKKYIFIYSDEPKTSPQSLKEIYQHLTELGERTIPIQEIAMAIVLCSCEKDCNPKFNRIHNVFMKQPSSSNSEIFPLAAETPSEIGSLDNTLHPKQEMIIPESLDTDLQILQTPKPEEQRKPFSPTNKRVAEVDLSTAKRMKLDESVPSTSGTSSSKKRKADDIPSQISKKSNLRENPFVKLINQAQAKKPATSNPFANLRIKKEALPIDDNPFKRLSGQKNEDPVLEVVEDLEPEQPRSTLPRNYCSSDTSNIAWLSKQESKSERSEERDEIEEDFKEIFKKFKNTVMIEVLPASAIRAVSTNETVDETLNSTVRNFKKFKKVRPLRPQISIISTTIMSNSQNGKTDTIGSDGEDEDSEDEDDQEEIQRPVRVNTTRRFNF